MLKQKWLDIKYATKVYLGLSLFLVIVIISVFVISDITFSPNPTYDATVVQEVLSESVTNVRTITAMNALSASSGDYYIANTSQVDLMLMYFNNGYTVVEYDDTFVLIELNDRRIRVEERNGTPYISVEEE